MQLAISSFIPLWQGSTSVDDGLADKLTGYSHDISVDGGYKKATIALASNIDEVESWIEHGVGRHIEVKNIGLETIWDGFVNSIEASIGALSITIGPLLDVVNRCRVDYKTISYNTSPPIGGNPATTGFGDNEQSQRVYGILETIISAGEVRDTQAAQIQQVYLNEWSKPDTTQRISLGGAGEISLTLNCVGYHELLKRFYFNRTTQLGEQNASSKIKDAIAQDPNGIMTGNMSSIQDNVTQIGASEEGGRTAWSVIKEIVSAGDAGGNRYIFGVYKDRIPKYERIPDDYEYTINIKQPPQTVKDRGGSEIRYWDVKPGKWLMIHDMLVGKGRPPFGSSVLSGDPRAVFIESVSFSAPNDLSINGGKVGTLQQIMARQGLGGA